MMVHSYIGISAVKKSATGELKKKIKPHPRMFIDLRERERETPMGERSIDWLPPVRTLTRG